MIYRFDTFELDMARFELRECGKPRSLEPQVLALLAYLIEQRDRMVPKDELFEKLWDGRVVTDSTLASRIKSARKALGDDGKAQRFIKTIYGKGFRFVADARAVQAAAVVTTGGGPADPRYAPEGVGAGESGAPRRPSIAVLPFREIGEASPYHTIADGLSHELITELARLRWLFVIARGSSFRFREEHVDLREVGRVLGVRYCLSGGVEVVGQKLAVTTELVDTRAAEVVWGERYTGFVDDVHAFREEMRSKILTALEIQIPLNEAARARLVSSENLDAWSAYHLGLQHLYRFNRKDNAAIS